MSVSSIPTPKTPDPPTAATSPAALEPPKMLAPGECSTTDCWISKAGVLVSLDPQFYPYITDQIISNLGLCDLLSFLTTSRYLRYKAIPVLLRHIIFIPHGASGRPKLYLPTAPMIRLPNFDWAVVQNLVKIADYRIPRRSQWLTKIVTAYRLPRLEMIRDLCGINLAPYVPSPHTGDWICWVDTGEDLTQIPSKVRDNAILVLRGLPDKAWVWEIQETSAEITIVFQGDWWKVDHSDPKQPPIWEDSGSMCGDDCYVQQTQCDGYCDLCIRVRISTRNTLTTLVSHFSQLIASPRFEHRTITLVNSKSILELAFVGGFFESQETLLCEVAKGTGLWLDGDINRFRFESTRQFRRRVGVDKFKLYTSQGYKSINC